MLRRALIAPLQTGKENVPSSCLQTAIGRWYCWESWRQGRVTPVTLVWCLGCRRRGGLGGIIFSFPLQKKSKDHFGLEGDEESTMLEDSVSPKK